MTKMMGAICGDILGSTYEWCNIKYCPTLKELLLRENFFTDDTVMTCAVAKALYDSFNELDRPLELNEKEEKLICKHIEDELINFGRKYPESGYGETFYDWIMLETRKPYNSWGNGSAMRVAYAGWISETLKETLFLAKCTAEVTHNHPYGIKGAQIVAACIYFLRQGANKTFIRDFVSKYYDMNFSLDEIRCSYEYDVSCQGSVPQAIMAFLEGNSFEEVISLAISIGGDSDTIAAIAGSIAEVIYPIPEKILDIAYKSLDEYLINTITMVVELLNK